jgi:hypothetical protein
MGYLAALTELGLMKNVRYITGISGGSWASSAYTFAPASVSDEEYLGSVTQPENITMAGLDIMSPKCARKSATLNFTAVFLKHILHGVSQAWVEAVSQVFLEPNGIDPRGMFSLNADTMKAIVAQNPSLASTKFNLPKAGRPFIVIGTALLGPSKMVPFDNRHRKYSQLEITPLYIGEPFIQNITYTRNHVVIKDGTETRIVGGLIEPFAFGGATAPATRLPSSTPSAMITVPSPGSHFFTLGNATASSSYAPGAVFSDIGILDSLGMEIPYWSPSADVQPGVGAEKYYFGDGGDVQNPNIIAMILRRVEHIIAFCNFVTPVRSTFDPNSTKITDKDMDDDIPAYFGIFVEKNKSETGTYINQNQIFATEKFAPLVRRFQEAQMAGRGIVVTETHTTVENKFWGVVAGIEVNITWVYLSRAAEWEAKLMDDDVKKHIIPRKNPEDPSNTIASGPFKSFPHYSTTELQLTNAQTNLLADLSGWVIEENRAEFEAALS